MNTEWKVAALPDVLPPSSGQDGSDPPPTPPLSFRTPDEICAWHFDDSDMVLEDRVMAKGQPLSICGAGGVGKSRLVLQLAACTTTGRPFLGINVCNPDVTWLIFQTENSNRRLKFDLWNLRRWLGADWPRFASRCWIHTLETDDDLLLNVDNPDTAARMRKAVQERNPTVVVFDPLNACTCGDLNKDQDMRATIMALSQIARIGNPERIPLILHHSLTGATGAARAVGYDRSSFSRNSKVLFAWTRAQINIAPASPDDNSLLVVSCGKNSNGHEFKPFGIQLNPDTMIYERLPGFDFDSWREELEGKAKKSESRCSIERVVDLLKPKQPLTKPELAKLLRDDTGLARSGCYEWIAKAERARVIKFAEDGLLLRVS